MNDWTVAGFDAWLDLVERRSGAAFRRRLRAGAREVPRRRVAPRSLDVETHVHPEARGPRRRDARHRRRRARRLAMPRDALLSRPGTHGVEGFCGSGCQVGLLADDAFVASVRAHAASPSCCVHALNPYGFAHLARTTEENVDLNRNFRDFGQAVRNDAYLEVHDFIVPATWPPAPRERDANRPVRREARRRRAAAGGDRRPVRPSPTACSSAARAPSWSQQVLRDVLRRARRAARSARMDRHPHRSRPAGHGEKIFAGPDDAAMFARAKAFWGADVTSIWDGSSTSAKVEGMLFYAALEECPDAEYTGIALEYGTLSYMDVLDGAARAAVACATIRTPTRQARGDPAPDPRRVLRRHAGVEGDGVRPGARGRAAGAGRAVSDA